MSNYDLQMIVDGKGDYEAENFAHNAWVGKRWADNRTLLWVGVNYKGVPYNYEFNSHKKII